MIALWCGIRRFRLFKADIPRKSRLLRGRLLWRYLRQRSRKKDSRWKEKADKFKRENSTKVPSLFLDFGSTGKELFFHCLLLRFFFHFFLFFFCPCILIPGTRVRSSGFSSKGFITHFSSLFFFFLLIARPPTEEKKRGTKGRNDKK